MRSTFLGILLAIFLFAPSLPVSAQTSGDLQERGEWMMEMMMGSRHEDFDQELASRYGEEFPDRMHEAMGQMAWQGGMGGVFAPTGMMGMMGGFGNSASVFGLFWIVIWSVNSILVGVLLWALIKRFLK